MYKKLKRVMALAMVLTIALGSFVTTNAAEKKVNTVGTIKQVEFTELDKKPMQEYKGILEDGTEYVVGVEEVTPNARSSTRTFKVYYNSGIVNCYFYMDVTDNRCSNAYNKKIICVGATYDNVSFTRNTSRAKLSFDISSYLDIVNFNGWLMGTCTGSNNDITVSYNF